jgi:hypothetical protein
MAQGLGTAFSISKSRFLLNIGNRFEIRASNFSKSLRLSVPITETNRKPHRVISKLIESRIPTPRKLCGNGVSKALRVHSSVPLR